MVTSPVVLARFLNALVTQFAVVAVEPRRVASTAEVIVPQILTFVVRRARIGNARIKIGAPGTEITAIADTREIRPVDVRARAVHTPEIGTRKAAVFDLTQGPVVGMWADAGPWCATEF